VPDPSERRVAVVVLAAGAGTRVGGEVNKVLLPLAGVPVVAHSVRTACQVPGVRRVVLVVRDGEQDAVRQAVEPHLPPETTDAPPSGPDGAAPEVGMVTGGATRHLSEWAALSWLAADIEAGRLDLVAMHDAARPLASVALYDEVLTVAQRRGGAIPVFGLDDLVAEDDSVGTVPMVGVQTPQAFRARDLLEAHRAAAADGFEATDTAGILAAYTDVAVGVVASGEQNLKLTVPHDFGVAEALIAR
jgi:2-C-methyl-D-erythritol 4-phosphate cytidylyltransferase